MACNNILNITKNCLSNIGGILEFYYIDQDLVTEIVYNETTHTITSITADEEMKSIYFTRNTGNFVSEAAIDFANGSTFYNQTITLLLHRRQAATSRALKIAGEGQRDLFIIVKDANGLYWAFDHSRLATNGDGSGTAKADGSKYAISFVAESETLEFEVDSSIISDLINPIS